ncbi:hypothetical protein SAY86_024030 [Trapa natans]|uniref:SHSP domain-containing protein n=1 Tax=Trapa natans TaxID=22666 RepID=A0AAN7R9V7_TRANT|nr:hypothetical protein SAY86_024030 [Trapa natans]
MQSKKICVDFEPVFKQNIRGENDTIEIHVQEFRKSELRVEVCSAGILRIIGERQLADRGSGWSRFFREFKLADQHCLNCIHAKLANGVLNITVPRKYVSPLTPCSDMGKGFLWRLRSIDWGRVLQVSSVLVAAVAIGVGTCLASQHWLKDDVCTKLKK